MKKRTIILGLILMVSVMLLSGCMPGDGSYVEDHYANFISGIWHGWIAPVSLIVSLFKDGIRIYEPYNTGWWYDFGFYVAIISGFGGLGLSRKKRKKDK